MMCDDPVDSYTNRLHAGITIRTNKPTSCQNERLVRIANLASNTQVITDEAARLAKPNGFASASMQNISSNTLAYVQENTIEKREWSSVENFLGSDVVDQQQAVEHTPNTQATRDNSYFEKFNRFSQSKSQSPNPNSLYRKKELLMRQRNQVWNGKPARSQTPPRIKLNISLAPNFKLRESDFLDSNQAETDFVDKKQRASSCTDERPTGSTLGLSRHSVGRGVSPFTFIETTSIKHKTNRSNLSQELKLDRPMPPPPPARKQSHKTLFLTKLSPKQSRKNLQVLPSTLRGTCFLKKDFFRVEFLFSA
jgi:hypothetical protein